ncbi:hypothetical protein Tco_1101951 [Tanacetum coccineum]
MGLWYPKDIGFNLTAFVDSDHVGCQDSRKSTSGSAQFLRETLVSWLSKKQKFDSNKIPLYCDSQSVIVFSCYTVQHSRTKHIAVRYHFIKEQVENEIVELNFVKTAYQLANIFTKELATSNLWTKNIAVRYHFIKEQVENEIVELNFVKTAYQLANIFTKELKHLGLESITPEELKHLVESEEDKE